MILTDTSVLIEWSRMPSVPVGRILASGRASVCGVTVAEMFEAFDRSLNARTWS